MAGKIRKIKEALRPDTTLVQVGEPEAEIYVGALPLCCLRSFKGAVVEGGDRRLLELQCSCERNWHVTSSLDELVLTRFVTHGGPRVGGTYPAA
jgi:hypothetical protein